MWWGRSALRRRWGISASLALALLAISAAADFGRAPLDPGALLGLRPTAVLAAATTARPNIILITTDDQATSDMPWMPKTRAALGASGVTFSTGISPHPLCCPARAEILTGQYAHNNGVYTNTGVNGGYSHLTDPNNTLPLWLSQAGYKTALIGKFLNGYNYTLNGRPAGWDMWDPTIIGTYDYFNYTQANDGNPKASDGEYITDYVAARSRSVIKNFSKNQSAPFFLWASYVAPHNVCDSEFDGLNCGTPPRPEPDYAAAYPTAVNPSFAKPSYNEANVKDKSHSVRHFRPISDTVAQQMFLARIRSLASVDDAVADTVAALSEQGQLENTVIIFTSDNGWMMGEHRYLGKRLLFEESLRVPMIMRGPGVPAGVLNTATASILDIAPTIVELAGAKPGRTLDGNSLLDLLSVSSDDRQTRLIQAGNVTNNPLDPKFDMRGIREKRFTYVRWRSGFIELYDRKKDPYQLKNVADKWKYKPIRKEMRLRYLALRSCVGVSQCYQQFAKPPKIRHR